MHERTFILTCQAAALLSGCWHEDDPRPDPHFHEEDAAIIRPPSPPDASAPDGAIVPGERDAAVSSPEACAKVTLLGREDQSGTVVRLEGTSAEATTDRAGRFCIRDVTDFSGRVSITMGPRRELLPDVSIRGHMINVWTDTTTEPWTELELSSLPRVVSGDFERIYPAETAPTFLFTRNRRTGAASDVPTQVADLARGFFDGTAPEPLGNVEVTRGKENRETSLVQRAPTGSRFLYRNEVGDALLLDVASGAPSHVGKGSWLGLSFADSALLFDGAVRSVDLRATESHTPLLLASDVTMGAIDLSQPWVRVGPDGYVYYSDKRDVLENPHAIAPLRRVNIVGGTAQLVAQEALVGSLSVAPSLTWIAFARSWTGPQDLRYVVAKLDGSDAVELPPPYRASGALRIQAVGTGLAIESDGEPFHVSYDPMDGSAVRALGDGFFYGVASNVVALVSSLDVDAARTLKLVNLEGTTLLSISLAAHAEPTQLQVSRDGKNLSYQEGDTFHLRSFDGAFHHQVAQAFFHSESPDHQYLAVWESKSTSQGTLHLMSWDGATHTAIADVHASLAFGADDTIVYASMASDGRTTLHVASYAGQHRLAVPAADYPFFSPNRTRWVFTLVDPLGPVLASLDKRGQVRVHARGSVMSWLSETKLLVTHHDDISYQSGLYALDLDE